MPASSTSFSLLILGMILILAYFLLTFVFAEISEMLAILRQGRSWKTYFKDIWNCYEVTLILVGIFFG